MLNESAAEQDMENWRKYRGRLGEDARATPVYRLKLNGPMPEGLKLYPQNLRVGNKQRGEELMLGRWQIGRHIVETGKDAAPWDVPGPSRHFADRLHRFAWLTDMCATGSVGQRRGRELIAGWVEEFGRWNGFVWRVPVTADRIWNWLTGGPNLFDTQMPDSEVLQSLIRQVRHLQHSTDDCQEPRVVLRSLFVQLIMAFSIEEGDRRIAQLEARIAMELNQQILLDGGHVSRNPEALLDVLIDLQTLDDLYLRTGRPTLSFVAKIVPRMAGMLQFLQVSDGGLPIMNGGGEGSRENLENALSPYAASRAFAFATKSGIQKLEAEGMRILLDAGPAPAARYAHEAHAGALSFELEDNGERIITNCGSHRDVGPAWQSATRRTDGHSTLVLSGQNSASFIPVRALGLEAPAGPAGVSARRLEEKSKILLDAQHSGWKEVYGLTHRRRLFLDTDGSRVSGEDTLFRPLSAGTSSSTDAIPYDVRFHLHPDVRLKQDGDHLRILLPSGNSWLFRTEHERKSIERSVYLARGTAEPCWQLVLSSDAEPNGDAKTPGNIVKWELIRD